MKEMFLVIVGPNNILKPNYKTKLSLWVFLQMSLIFRTETETNWVHLNIFIDRKTLPGESIRHFGGVE